VTSFSLPLYVAFDLVVNAVGSFAIAALIVALAVKATRLAPGRAAQALWAVPFAKVVWDAAQGIPGDAFFWVRLAGVRQRIGSFMVGGGMKAVVPAFHAAFAAITDVGKRPSTIGDYAAVFLTRRIGPSAPLVVAAAVLFVAAARLVLRSVRLVLGERELARLRARARLLEVRRVGPRRVEVFVSSDHRGAPFTGGVFSAYVCFPEATFEVLSLGERAASLEHELAHVAHRDLVLGTVLSLLEDVLWFVPGRAAVRRRFDTATEVLADRAAVNAGASPVDLAMALVRVHEALVATRAAPSTALIGFCSQLAERAARILGRAPRPRLGLDRPWAQALFAGWVAAAAIVSTLFGHP
jgi:beta-lactamase regulating signal transducer with metallopeptidase domain